MGKPNIKLVVTDADNTCWDWMGPYIPAMEGMITKAAEIAGHGLTAAALYPEVRKVHQQHGTSEYGFVLEEMPTLQWLKLAQFDPCPIAEIYRPAIELYRHEYDSRLALYPGVADTFNFIRSLGTPCVMFTESQAFPTFTRLKKLHADGLVDVLFTPVDPAIPAGIDLRRERSHPPEYYELEHTLHLTVPRGTKKPDPGMLTDIMNFYGVKPSEVLVIGDHLWKDIWMAQQAGAHAAYAQYGTYGDAGQKNEYARFMPLVSFYTDADFEREKQGRLIAAQVMPQVVLKQGMSELLSHFNFVPGPQVDLRHLVRQPAIHPTPVSA